MKKLLLIYFCLGVIFCSAQKTVPSYKYTYYFQSNNYESKFELLQDQNISVWQEIEDLMPNENFSGNFERYTDYMRRVVMVNHTDSTMVSNYNPMYAMYYVKEKIPQHAWQILDSATTVLGKSCGVARTKFRGRTYYAHYAPEISDPRGPWKFGGLPGMILKVETEDETDYFKMECIEIRTVDENLKLEKRMQKFLKKHRKKFLSWDEFLKDFDAHFQKTIKYWKTQHEGDDEGNAGFRLMNFIEVFHECQTKTIWY